MIGVFFVLALALAGSVIFSAVHVRQYFRLLSRQCEQEQSSKILPGALDLSEVDIESYYSTYLPRNLSQACPDSASMDSDFNLSVANRLPNFRYCKGRIKRLNTDTPLPAKDTCYRCLGCGIEVITKVGARRFHTPVFQFQAKDNVTCRITFRYLANCHGGKDMTRFACKLCGSVGTLEDLMEHLRHNHRSWELRYRIKSTRHFQIVDPESMSDSDDLEVRLMMSIAGRLPINEAFYREKSSDHATADL